MRYAYIAVGILISTLGAWHVFEDLFDNDFFLRGLAAFAGFSLVLLGVLNLLNQAYGSTARGLRLTVIASNVAFLAIALLVWTRSSPDWVLIATVSIGTLLSLDRRSMRAEPAA